MTRFIAVQDHAPAPEPKTRYEPPENLYIVVGGVVFPTYDFEHGVIISPTRGDLRAGRAFHPANMSSGRLRAHLSSINRACDASQFISAFEDDGRRVFVELASAWIIGDVEVAMQMQPLCLRDALGDRVTSPHAAKLIVNTSGLRPGWWGPSASLATIPVWYVDVPDTSDSSIWICVDEVRELCGLERRHGTRGEWLACGHIPRSMIDAQVVLQEHQRKLYDVRNESIQGCGCTSIRQAASTQQAEHVRENRPPGTE